MTSTTPEPMTDEDLFSTISSPGSFSSPIEHMPMYRMLNSPLATPLQLLIDEEMRIAERRRIMFCERPVGSLLGASKSCVSYCIKLFSYIKINVNFQPYTKNDIKPLVFRNFRKSIRTHILLIYEWLRALPDYSTLSMNDQVSVLAILNTVRN